MYLGRYKSILYVSSLLVSHLAIVSGSDKPNTPRGDDSEELTLHTLSSYYSYAAPLLELNETDILQTHDTEPLPYWDHDFNEPTRHHRSLMGFHVLGMCLSYFCLLPAGIVLRAMRHPMHGATVVAFGIVAFLSSAAGSLYKKFTGDLYAGSVHGRHGFFVLGLFSALALCDALAFFQRTAKFLKSRQRRNIRVFWRSVILNQELRTSDEYVSLDSEEPGILGNLHKSLSKRSRSNKTRKQINGPYMNSRGSVQNSQTSITLSDDAFHSPSGSAASSSPSLDAAQHAPISTRREHQKTHGRENLAAIGGAIFAIVERSLLILALMQVMSGITVYTGICRQNWIAGCIGHMIKGGITVCYGLVTFARYLGLWSNLGWAWNKLPQRYHAQNIPTAETVECLFFILYGIVMTFTERVGTEPGPFTTIQIQHISIAVMYFVAGLLGLALESKILRGWLSAPAQACVMSEERVTKPPSYIGSFNPFPALVVGVTGVSISAHPQKYIFAVKLHALWGNLLFGFAILRCLTYFFLWLRPPQSVLPSRPPTEALASFSLTCGGLLLILSTEQIEFAAMRRGHGDVMLFLNFAVAVTYLAFFWVLIIIAFKGWLTPRSQAP